MQDSTKKKIAPVVITILVLVYLGPIIGLVLAALAGLEGNAPIGFLTFIVLYAAIGGAAMVGILIALGQRLKEIDGGEEEDAKKY